MIIILIIMFRKRVDNSANPSFPRPTGTWWFGCSSENQPLTASGDHDDDDDNDDKCNDEDKENDNTKGYLGCSLKKDNNGEDYSKNKMSKCW